MAVWQQKNWLEPIIVESFDPERTTLTLSTKANQKSGDKKVAIKTVEHKQAIIEYLTDHVSATSQDFIDLLGIKICDRLRPQCTRRGIS